MSAASYRRRAAGVVSAVILAVCGPLTVSSSAQTQAQAPTGTAGTPAAAQSKHSVVTWGASADRQSAGPADRSYRLIVRTSVGGTNMRIRLSNAFGDHPVTFANAYAGLRKQGAELVHGSNRKLSFDGAASVTVPAGETVLSDPLPGKLAAQSDLVVSLYVTGAQGPTTGHGMAMQTNYATAGDHAAEEGAANWTDPMGSWYWLDAVDVETSTAVSSVVALGDSITDGWASTTDGNRRWPDYLARRLQAASGSTVKGVANEGISGNKVLADGAGEAALKRLQRDVLSQPGVSTVFLFEGINDIKAHSGVTVEDMIAGYQEIIDRAHTAGKCVVGATVMPFKGWYEYDDASEAVRQGVNDWIRNSGALDAVTDFDKITRSPYDQQRILPFFDGGDHLHPNDKGMQAMADAVDLKALGCRATGGTQAARG
ncbi:G-D-S-L family lipolytic protein [Streptomyces avermitilis]|uniref:Secreted protein n=2 Tax=Streptomyces avermitilis TaxID=33903 RepID=Q82P58_STRAW|nr:MULTISPECIES: SGNH/GDSL hydrolase family protein [Streptomyces]KUN54804.1 G-D-S-L family lipolytic protein [Streptomyces avermitilis]MYS96708.1 SGNH/GDSL hydrolase family protein [Streptomyces sp. SID5469]OOV13140.1 G-D-S-L family lipolytic protein [Streptomyces avermitilis]BAC68785.1 putative secreted protein [Streptomyces avermitilis MA-4680 = NBRC 14893]BBJ48709.1 SGNH hydrolase [Streptomyces avermitilis]